MSVTFDTDEIALVEARELISGAIRATPRRAKGTLYRALAAISGNGREARPHELSATRWAFVEDREAFEESESSVTCVACGDSIDRDDMQLGDNNAYCESCFNDNYGTCERCEETIARDDLQTVGDHAWCPNCVSLHAWTCERCSEVYANDDGCNCNVQGDIICQTCYADMCEGCADGSDDEPDGPIAEYGHTRNMPKYGNPRDGIYFGVELEVEVSGDRAASAEHTLWRMGEFVQCKEDGSLNHGYEIVTAPATLEVHREKWDAFFDHPPANTTSWKEGTCGMHVHVSRKPLSQLAICKIGAFLNENPAFTEQIAGRSSSRWASINKKSKLADYREDDGDRYHALNLTNSATIEIRIFRGTMKRESFYKNLEFGHALVYFARSTESSLKALTPTRFACWVRKNRKQYLNLDNWLVANGYLGRATKPNHINPQPQAEALAAY
jgi:hypothetical protein